VSCRRYTDEENICTFKSEYDINNTPPIFLSEIFLTIKIWNIVFKQKRTDMEDKKMFKIFTVDILLPLAVATFARINDKCLQCICKIESDFRSLVMVVVN